MNLSSGDDTQSRRSRGFVLIIHRAHTIWGLPFTPTSASIAYLPDQRGKGKGKSDQPRSANSVGESGELGTHDTVTSRAVQASKQATVHVTRATLAQQCALYIYTPLQCSRIRLRVLVIGDKVILRPVVRYRHIVEMVTNLNYTMYRRYSQSRAFRKQEI